MAADMKVSQTERVSSVSDAFHAGAGNEEGHAAAASRRMLQSRIRLLPVSPFGPFLNGVFPINYVHKIYRFLASPLCPKHLFTHCLRFWVQWILLLRSTNRCKVFFIKYVSKHKHDHASIKPPMNWWTWVTSYCKSTSNWKGHIGRGVKSHSIPILIKMPFWRYFQESAQTIARTSLQSSQIILSWISGLYDVCILLG